jgi:CBS domain-containing protein
MPDVPFLLPKTRNLDVTRRSLSRVLCRKVVDKSDPNSTEADSTGGTSRTILARFTLARACAKRDQTADQEQLTMKIQDIMSTEPATVTPDTPITEAARIMKDHNIGMLPVVETEGSRRLVGVVTDRDIAIRHVAEGHTSDCPVREAMTDNVSTCTPDENVDRVMNLMAEEQVRRIPIVDERGDLVGVVSQADIVLEAGDSLKAEKTVEQISRPYGKHAD